MPEDRGLRPCFESPDQTKIPSPVGDGGIWTQQEQLHEGREAEGSGFVWDLAAQSRQALIFLLLAIPQKVIL